MKLVIFTFNANIIENNHSLFLKFKIDRKFAFEIKTLILKDTTPNMIDILDTPNKILLGKKFPKKEQF